MESNGKYQALLYNLLQDMIHVTITNPTWVKAVMDNKDDIKDSK